MARQWWPAVGGLAGVAGVIIALVQFFLVSPSRILILSSAVFLLLLVVALAVLVTHNRRQPTQLLININSPEREKRYYELYARAVRGVKKEIYHAARGFDGLTDRSAQYSNMISLATREAIQGGARLTRIQTSGQVSDSWAEGYARLVEDFPQLVSIYADLSDPTLTNVIVYDPEEGSSVVQIIFEAETYLGDRQIFRLVGALFLFGNEEVARGLQRLFVNRLKAIQGQKLSAAALRNLNRPASAGRAHGEGRNAMSSMQVLYFAYGANVNPDRMRERCPAARVVGSGLLSGWCMKFNVPSPYYSDGLVANVYPHPEDRVQGVVYALNGEDRSNLDSVEGAADYDVSWVEAEVNGLRLPCYIYTVRQEQDAPEQPSARYLRNLLAGAEHFDLDEMRRQVLAARDSIA